MSRTARPAAVRACAAAAAFAAALAFGAGPAAAQDQPGTVRVPAAGASTTQQPVVVNANEITYDRERAIVTARGNVIIFQGDRVVLADQVEYNQRTNRVIATGNVAITEPGGQTLFATRAELTRDMKDAVIEQLRFLLPDQSKMAANGAVRVDGKRMTMAKVVFSPCRLCESDPSRAPLWQIRARKVVHDQDTHDIVYRDAWIEVFGTPVIYTPWLSHPDPTVKRRTGFLRPIFGSDDYLGRTIRMPYFVVIDRDKDATIMPLLSTKQNPALIGQYRQRFPGGALITEASFTRTRRSDDFSTPQSGFEFRGHWRGNIRYDIDSNWRFSAEGGLVTDKTYLRRYMRDGSDSLNSIARLEGFFGRNFAQLRTMHFRTLRISQEQERIPFVVPFAEYSAIGDPVGRWGRWFFDSSFLATYRTDGVESRRISMTAGWRIPYVDPLGWTLVTTASVNTDLYWVVGNDAGGLPTFSGTVGRLYPRLRLDWRYPFVRELGNVRQVVEPRVVMVATPPKLNTWRIPNEDSLDLDLDDLTLFADNRYPGRDRIDDGVRVVYGIGSTLFGNRGGKSEIFIGQSWRVFGEDNVLENSGIRNRLSDIVGRVRVSPADYLNFLYRVRLSARNFSSHAQEATINAGVPAFNFSVSYVDVSDLLSSGEFDARRQLNFFARSRITQNWSVFGGAVIDFNPTSSDRRLQRWTLSTVYKNECCTVTFSYARQFDVITDGKPTNSFMVTISLKYLGDLRLSR